MDQGYRIATRTQLNTQKNSSHHGIIYLKALSSIVLQCRIIDL